MTSPRTALLALLAILPGASTALAQIGTVQNIAPGVYFHEGDPRLGTCNNGWVVLDDYVVVIDANYPVGARMVIPKVRATTSRPVRFVVDTHFHPDHAFGNQAWADEGATIVSQEFALAELKRSGAAAWELSANTRPDVASSKLCLPTLTFANSLAFESAGRRVELRWPGVAHTGGDTLIWLPREKILFTGDVCVNGSFNYLHDSDISQWIKALEGLKKLGAERVCPGHGPLGGPELIADQQAYFIELTHGVQGLVAAGKSAVEVKAAVSGLAAQLRRNRQIARYVPTDFYFAAHVEKSYMELAGIPLPR